MALISYIDYRIVLSLSKMIGYLSSLQPICQSYRQIKHFKVDLYVMYSTSFKLIVCEQLYSCKQSKETFMLFLYGCTFIYNLLIK